MVLLAARIARPFVVVRFGELKFAKIGHLSINTELYLRKREYLGKWPGEIHVFASGRACNEQLVNMISRRVPIVRGSFVLAVVRAIGQFSVDHSIKLPYNADEYLEFNTGAPTLSFTDREEEEGQTLLRSIGVDPSQPFICFHARDSAYHTGRPDQDHRNCSVENYLGAAAYLTRIGYPFIRTGQISNQTLQNVPGALDYSANHRTEFGDIYLHAKCRFFLGNSSGLWTLSTTFNVPVAIANVIHLFMPLRRDCLFIPKKLREKGTGRILGFREIFARGIDGWDHAPLYAGAGIEPMENTSDEIRDLAMEMELRLSGRWDETGEGDELQARFRDLIPYAHPFRDFPSRIGASFLRENESMLA